MAQKMKSLFNWISGMKLRYRMLIVYIIGGALPIITIGLYLVHGIKYFDRAGKKCRRN